MKERIGPGRKVYPAHGEEDVQQSIVVEVDPIAVARRRIARLGESTCLDRGEGPVAPVEIQRGDDGGTGRRQIELLRPQIEKAIAVHIDPMSRDPGALVADDRADLAFESRGERTVTVVPVELVGRAPVMEVVLTWATKTSR